MDITTSSGNKLIFDSDGKLQSRRFRSGVQHNLSYNQTTGLLETITHSIDGSSLGYAYNANSKIETITASSGDVLHYSYDTEGNLATVTLNDESPRTYHYEDIDFPSFLTGITDERGIRYLSWTYDDQGRADSSEMASNQNQTALVHNGDNTTSVTNALGKQTTYHFQELFGVRKVTQLEGHASTNCAAANQAYSYYPDTGLMETRTDWRGNVTRYTYHANGLEASRTVAENTPDERVVTTTWIDEFNFAGRHYRAGAHNRL